MVAEQIRETLKGLTDTDAEFTVERPKQPGHGDLASNVAMVVAKKQGVNPRSLAEQLQEKLAKDDRFIDISVAGPGFLNFKLAPVTWHRALAEIIEAGDKYGTYPTTGQTIQVEFISANPTGPLTLGNGRGGFGGDVLARVFERAGHEVEREYYLNDAGAQIAELGATLKGAAESYKGEYVEEIREKVDLDGDAAEVGRRAAELLRKDVEHTVKRMGISFDTWFSESQELHEKGEVDRTLALLAKVDATYEKDGALWLKTTHADDDKDRVLRKSDGELTYLAADLAYHYHKLAVRKFDRAIDIWGADHHGYVERLRAGVEFLRKAEHFDGKLELLIVQLVRLVQGGQEVKMSKRAGTYVTLDELLDQVDADVARFFFTMKSFDTHMDFDLDLAKEQSQKNPVYYVKYAHARVAGILGKAGRRPAGDLKFLTHPAELALISRLVEFPEVIRRTAADYQVQRLPHFAMEIADAFHKFYEQCPVISNDQDLTAARLALVEGTRQVLANAADTIGIGLPDDM